jgi:hypothetical protein
MKIANIVIVSRHRRDIVEPKRSGSLSTYFRGRPLGRGARSHATYAPTAALLIITALASALLKAPTIASSRPRDILGRPKRVPTARIELSPNERIRERVARIVRLWQHAEQPA